MKFIEPSHLSDDEIEYELRIRSMPPVITRHRVDTLRERFISEMRKEVDSPTRGLITPLSEDLDICVEKLLGLEKKLYECADKESEEVLLVLISRMSHLKSRLGRFKVGSSKDGLLIDGLLFKLSNYLSIIDAAMEKKVTLKNGLKSLFSTPNQSRSDSIQTNSNKTSPIVAIPKPLGAIPKQIPIITIEDQMTPRNDAGEDLSDFYDSFGYELQGAVGGTTKNQKKTTSSGNVNVDDLLNISDLRLGASSNSVDSANRPRESNDDLFSLPYTGLHSKKKYVKEPLRNPNVVEDNLSSENTELRNVESVNPPNRPNNIERTNVQNPYNNQHNVNQQNFNNVMAGNTPANVPNRIQNFPVQNHRQNYRNPIPNWHLCFTGDGKGLSVNDFLRQVNYMARADRVGNLELLESAIHLFSGPARNWYMAFERSFDCWETLKIALRRQFITRDGDFGIMKEIEQRLQLKDEPFIFYLSSLLNMFDQLRIPLSERNKVDLVLRNISPHLAEKLAVFEVNNLQDLSAICKQIEDVQNKIKTRRPEPVAQNYSRNRINEVEMCELDVRKTMKPISVLKHKCVNCRESGHDFKQCTKEKMRIFCFRCGELGQTTYSCPCSNMGNPQRESKINEVYSSSQIN